jgi:hypothetical protein
MTYYGQWSPKTDEVLFENYFKDKRNGFFIECGAADGIEASNTLFFEQELGWTGICIEPSKAYYQLIVNRPNCINKRNVLTNYNGPIIFEEATHPLEVSGGTVEYNPRHKEHVAELGFEFFYLDSDGITYAKLMKSLKVKEVDLFSLDTDGHELEIISGMGEPLPRVICVEYTVVGSEKIKTALNSLGYNFDFISFNNLFFSIGFPSREDWFGATEWMQGYLPEGVI